MAPATRPARACTPCRTAAGAESGSAASGQKWGALPNGYTDYIFAILGEELGVAGTLSVLVLSALFAVAGMRIAVVVDDMFDRFTATRITFWVLSQTILKIGDMTSTLSITSIWLPLLSDGARSLAVTLFAVGLLVSIGRRTRNTKRDHRADASLRQHQRSTDREKRPEPGTQSSGDTMRNARAGRGHSAAPDDGPSGAQRPVVPASRQAAVLARQHRRRPVQREPAPPDHTGLSGADRPCQGTQPQRPCVVPKSSPRLRLAGALALLAVLTQQVLTNSLLGALDRALEHVLTLNRPNGLRAAASLLTTLGNPTVVVPFLLTVAVGVSLRSRSWRPLLSALLAMAALAAAVLSLKYAVARPGPAGIAAHGGAWPSGHTTTAVVVWGVFVQMLRLHGAPRRLLAGVLPVVVGATLVFAGYHWLSDVLAGWVLGNLLLLVAVRSEMSRPGDRPRAVVPPV